MANKCTKDIYRDPKTGKIIKQEPHVCNDDILSNILYIGVSALVNLAVTEFVKVLKKHFSSKNSGAIKSNKTIYISHFNVKRSYSAKRAHLTKKTKIVIEEFELLLKSKSPKSIIRILSNIIKQLENLEIYANELISTDIRISINDEVWGQFINMKIKVEESCKNLKGKLIENKIYDFPKFHYPHLDKNTHRTMNEISLVKNQFEHSIELASFLQRELQSKSLNGVNQKTLLLK